MFELSRRKNKTTIELKQQQQDLVKLKETLKSLNEVILRLVSKSPTETG